MTSSAEVKSARCAAFRASDDIEDSALDVDVATQAVDPASVVGDVWVKADEDQEKDSCAQPQNYVHNATESPILRLVKLWDEGHRETSEADQAETPHVNQLCSVNLDTCHSIIRNWEG